MAATQMQESAEPCASEPEAFRRITSSRELTRCLADLALIRVALPDNAARKLDSAVVLLTECLAELLGPDSLPVQQPAGPRRISDAEHCAAIVNRMRDCDPGQRKQAVMTRTGWSRSKYYRELDAAEEMGLLR